MLGTCCVRVLSKPLGTVLIVVKNHRCQTVAGYIENLWHPLLVWSADTSYIAFRGRTHCARYERCKFHWVTFGQSQDFPKECETALIKHCGGPLLPSFGQNPCVRDKRSDLAGTPAESCVDPCPPHPLAQPPPLHLYINVHIICIICVYIYIYIYIQCMYIYIYTYKYIHVYVNIYICIYI